MSHIKRVALTVALLIIGVAVITKYALLNKGVAVIDPNYTLTLGKAGSEHSHASILIIINDKIVDLSDSKYANQSEYAHMHDNEPYYIHKHARGVSLYMFLISLGISVTDDCISLDGIKHCTDTTNTLTLWVNRATLKVNLEHYEIRNGDKIFINYGTDTLEELNFKANSLPDLSPDLEQNG